MLTLQEPIQLQSTKQSLTLTEGFGERIAANYQIMGARFTPKDLLLLLVAPPEYPETLGGGTSIAMQTDIRSTQNNLLEVVNNVTNRILLMHQESFTYQDQVYITSFLQKLGLTDVNQFIREVRALTEENRSVHRLLTLYQDNRQLLEAAYREHKPPKLPRRRKKAAKKQEGSPAEPGPSLHQSIYRRLATREIYQIVQRFQQNSAIERSAYHFTELRTAEQLRVSSLLALTQAKDRLFPQAGAVTLRHINRYETGDLLEPPSTEQQVLGQGAAAVFLDLIDNVMVTRLDRYLAKSDSWLDIRRAVSQSAVYSLSRFESYHTGASSRHIQEHNQIRQMSALYREEARLVERFLEDTRQANPSLIHHYYGGDTPEQTDASGELRLAVTNQGNRYLEAVTQLNLAVSQLSAEHQSLRREDYTSIASLVENTLLSGESRRILTQRFQLTLPESAPAAPEAAAPQMILQREEERLTQRLEELEHSAETRVESTEEIRRRLDEINRRNVERHRQTMERQAERPRFDSPATPDRRRTFQDALRALEDPQKVLEEMRATAPEPRKTPQQATMEVLLAQADPETRQIYEAVFQYQQNPQAAAQLGLVRPENLGSFNRQVSSVSAQATARAMEEISRETEETRRVRERLETALARPELRHATPRELALADVLEQADPETRAVFENVVRHRSDLSEAVRRGLVRSEQVVELDRRVQETEQVAARLVHRRESVTREELSGVAGSILSELGGIAAGAPGRAPSPGEQPPRPRVPTVHKAVEGGLPDELLERLEQQQRQQESVQTLTQQTVTRQTTSQTVVNEQSAELVQRTTDDIVEIVNRTLARQMGAISDQVLGRMERRLQLDRARRGRF